ncbi:hypothetical protein [Aporhodopirellula aestuarii]|uniref:Secreted protein n=1 Tax=Aporhodopirellula aestuarii TaxID=2950107 RepID=A0ABT0UCV9_9BACT|nr:hypothetical protein [Aporhodopirellula aestuarii]MCM2374847.1 hypothetical protein [Aporhodopirellula aestuarii]
MQRFTAQIALIAYVVGGWLLPAAHHHVHDHAKTSGACACVVAAGIDSNRDPDAESEAFPTSPAPASHGHSHDCCCDHSPESSVVESANADVDSSSNLVVGHSTSSDCQGLCALCCSISVVGQVSDARAISIAPLTSTGTSRHAGLAWPLPPLCGGISSRGPPAV